MAYTMTAGGQRFQFDDLKDVLAVASPARSGDALAGVAAQSDVQRFAAKMCLADLPLNTFLNDTVIPYENDEVTRLIIDTHDAEAFRPIASLTVGDFRNWLLSEQATPALLKAIAPAVTPEMAAAVSKLMRNQDLILAAKKCNMSTAFRNTLGLPGRMAVRLQPNHPTDDLKGILASTIDGLLYGCGDAVIGINPASDNPAVLSGILRMLDELIERFSIPTQTCVLTHVTSSIEMINAGAPVDLIFQSVAGSQKANSSFGIDLKVLQEGLDAGRSLNRGTVGNNCMYFETGQGSALSADAHFGVDQQTMEARAYAVCRQFEPLLVNTVVGFIGPEYLYDGKQIIRAGLEDHFCGKLMGLPIGADICYTNHADADQDDMDTLLTLLATAGVNFVIGVPGADDIMLNYQSTSFHDQLYIRELLGLKRAPEFETWLHGSGITDVNGRLLPQTAANNALMSLAEDPMMGAAA
jgi:ethanolamine ammonia-lyase large subunit